jgi:hypothetical protein
MDSVRKAAQISDCILFKTEKKFLGRDQNPNPVCICRGRTSKPNATRTKPLVYARRKFHLLPITATDLQKPSRLVKHGCPHSSCSCMYVL